MISTRHVSVLRLFLFLGAFLSVLSFLLFFPTKAEAHAILLRSDPVQDAQLRVAPTEVRLWFSEALNPAFSTLSVENAISQQRVDLHDATVAPNNTSELDVTLQPQLQAGFYTVIWSSDSNNDGHIESGSFLFTVLRPDGSRPTAQGSTLHTQPPTRAPQVSAFSTFFSLLMQTLLEVGAVFWVSAQLWLLFVLPKATARRTDETRARIDQQQITALFERRFAFPSLCVLLLANTGVLLGQALNLAGTQWVHAFVPSTLVSLVISSTFGVVWFLREFLLFLVLQLAIFPLVARSSSPRIQHLLQWVNLQFGLLLLTTMAFSSHAAALNTPFVKVAVVSDWLHLLAAVLWVGGMLSLALLALPVLTRQETLVQSRSLLTLVGAYTPWAVAGVVVMALTGPLSAATQLYGWQQLFTTLYGEILTLKILLVGLLLLTSAIHVFLLRPRLKRATAKYTATLARLRQHQQAGASEWYIKRFTQILALREKHLAQHNRLLTTVLRWEPTLGVAILVCVGLMSVFGGTLTPIPATPSQQAVASSRPQPFHTTMQTFDHAFTVALTITPNQLGTNQFAVTVMNTQSKTAAMHIHVRLNTEMPSMDMGIGIITLTADGNGHFHGSGDLAMIGQWQIIVQISTPSDPYHFREAYTTLSTP